MKRYLHTLFRFWSASLAAEMEYRINFLVATLVSLGNLVGNLFVLALFFSGSDLLGGWTLNEALMIAGLFTLLTGASESLLVPNLNRIVHYVQHGTLDYVLLKPMDSQFWLSARNVSPWGLPDMTFGVGLIVYSTVKLSLPVHASFVAVAAVALAATVMYAVWFILSATCVWFVKIHNVTHVLRSFMEAGRYPMTAYPIAYRFFLTCIVPVAFMTTVPAELILGKAGAPWFGGMLLMAAALFIVSRLWWRFALRYYTSASS